MLGVCMVVAINDHIFVCIHGRAYFRVKVTTKQQRANAEVHLIPSIAGNDGTPAPAPRKKKRHH